MSSTPLNPAQKKAVEHHLGPLLVLAGAGSGKTRVITQRIARLLERGVPAKSIVALTFTNKAAGEMHERIYSLLGQRKNAAAAKGLTVSTFHSFGLSILAREKKAIGGTFTIFDQGDCLSAVKEILAREGLHKNFDASAIVTRISNAKNAFLSEADLPDDGLDEYDEITKIVFPKYQAALRSFRAYDFDDLVCEVSRLWQSRADVLARWRDQFRFLLVDEYQDTNRAQLQLLRMLAEPHRNLCVVGDDDQSIYAWRGADVRNILEFEEHFPGATVIKLEQNYRSAAPILNVANAVIERRTDAGRHRKVLFTDRAGGETVHVRAATSPEIEARFVANEIKRLHRDEGKKLSEIAVLYRSNGQSKAIEEALREETIAHRVHGGQQFFERKEVKDLLSYLKLSLNRADEISLRRVINYPPRGIGDTSVERLTTHALAKGWSLWEAIERVDALDDIAPAARAGCKALEKIIGDTRKQLLVEGTKASAAARDLSERIGLKREVEATSPSAQAAGRRWSNVESLFMTFTRRELREAQAGTPTRAQEDSLAAFLHALTLNFDDDDDEKASREVATLSTLHGAKGLEFDVVFLVGCEEGLIPHSRTLDSRATDVTATTANGGSAINAPSDIEEERRLFYVGVTRARDVLYLLRAKARVARGKPMARTPSRFLVEIPEELVDVKDVTIDAPMSHEAAAQNADALLAMLDALK